MRWIFAIGIVLLAFWSAVFWAVTRAITAIVGPTLRLSQPKMVLVSVGSVTLFMMAVVVISGWAWRKLR